MPACDSRLPFLPADRASTMHRRDGHDCGCIRGGESDGVRHEADGDTHGWLKWMRSSKSAERRKSEGRGR